VFFLFVFFFAKKKERKKKGKTEDFRCPFPLHDMGEVLRNLGDLLHDASFLSLLSLRGVPKESLSRLSSSTPLTVPTQTSVDTRAPNPNPNLNQSPNPIPNPNPSFDSCAPSNCPCCARSEIGLKWQQLAKLRDAVSLGRTVVSGGKKDGCCDADWAPRCSACGTEHSHGPNEPKRTPWIL
jgi:hypothetical protein